MEKDTTEAQTEDKNSQEQREEFMAESFEEVPPVIAETPLEEQRTRKGSQESKSVFESRPLEGKDRRDQRIQSRRSSSRSEVSV